MIDNKEYNEYTLKQFAEILDINPTRYTKLEKIGTVDEYDEVTSLSLKEIKCYHDKLGICYDWLFQKSEEKYPQNHSCGKLGLSDKAIENLELLYIQSDNERKKELEKNIGDFESYRFKLNFINALLEDEDLFDNIFNSILYYLDRSKSEYYHNDSISGMKLCDSNTNKRINKFLACETLFEAIDKYENKFKQIFSVEEITKNRK